MSHLPHIQALSPKQLTVRSGRTASRLRLLALLLLVPLAAHAQGSPFDNGFTALQTLFTGTVAKVASLIAIVIGGYQFAHATLDLGVHQYVCFSAIEVCSLSQPVPPNA